MRLEQPSLTPGQSQVAPALAPGVHISEQICGFNTVTVFRLSAPLVPNDQDPRDVQGTSIVRDLETKMRSLATQAFTPPGVRTGVAVRTSVEEPPTAAPAPGNSRQPAEAPRTSAAQHRHDLVAAARRAIKAVLVAIRGRALVRIAGLLDHRVLDLCLDRAQRSLVLAQCLRIFCTLATRAAVRDIGLQLGQSTTSVYPHLRWLQSTDRKVHAALQRCLHRLGELFVRHATDLPTTLLAARDCVLRVLLTGAGQPDLQQASALRSKAQSLVSTLGDNQQQPLSVTDLCVCAELLHRQAQSLPAPRMHCLHELIQLDQERIWFWLQWFLRNQNHLPPLASVSHRPFLIPDSLPLAPGQRACQAMADLDYAAACGWVGQLVRCRLTAYTRSRVADPATRETMDQGAAAVLQQTELLAKGVTSEQESVWEQDREPVISVQACDGSCCPSPKPAGCTLEPHMMPASGISLDTHLLGKAWVPGMGWAPFMASAATADDQRRVQTIAKYLTQLVEVETGILGALGLPEHLSPVLSLVIQPPRSAHLVHRTKARRSVPITLQTTWEKALKQRRPTRRRKSPPQTKQPRRKRQRTSVAVVQTPAVKTGAGVSVSRPTRGGQPLSQVTTGKGGRRRPKRAPRQKERTTETAHLLTTSGVARQTPHPTALAVS